MIKGGGTETIYSGCGKVYDGVIQGLRPRVHDDIASMYRIWNAASEESTVKCFKKSNCMHIVVNEETESVPVAAESDALNNDALYDDIADSIGYIRIELIVEDEANTRDDF